MEDYLMNEPFEKDEKTKQEFTDALDRINENNKIHQNDIKYTNNSMITGRSAIIGHDIFKETMNELTIKKEIIEPDTEPIKFKKFSVRLERLDPDVIKNLMMKKNKSVSNDNVDNDGVKNVKTQNKLIARKKPKPIFISRKKKLEIINLLRQNPTWTIRMIREKSKCYSCCCLPQIKRWIASFKKGGSSSEHMNILNCYVYKKCIQFKNQKKYVTDQDLIKWANEAVEKNNIPCSKHWTRWLRRFKQIYCLSVPTNPNCQDDDDDCDKSNFSDIANENDKETDDAVALNFNGIDKLSMENSRKRYPSFEDKKKVINLIRQNPTWSLEEIKKHSNCKYIFVQQLRSWAKCVDRGVSITEAKMKINNWVYQKCLLYKKRNKKISNQLIRKWGLEARNIMLPQDYKNSNPFFAASKSWAHYFKKKYNINGKNAHELQVADEINVNKTSNHQFSFSIVPFETKLQIVNTIRENPDWTFQMIQDHCGYNKRLDKRTILSWTEQVDNGGSVHEKMEKLNNWTYQKCVEHKKNNQQLSFDNIREFGRQAQEVFFPDKKNRLSFKASFSWINKFRKSFGIVGKSPHLIITQKLPNDEISSTTEDHSEESPVAAEDEPDESSVKSNTRKIITTYDDKIKVIELARENPTWTITKLREVSGVKWLRGMYVLNLWKKQIESGGSRYEKLVRINHWLDNKVNEYKSDNKVLTREIIEGFFIEAKKSLKIKNLSIPRGRSWWSDFDKKHNLGGINRSNQSSNQN